MRNTISVDESGNEFSSSLNDGTNSLVINDVEIDSSEWVGSGNYTTTVNGYTLSIAKVPSLIGNVILVNETDYNYSLLRTTGMQPGLLDTIYPVGSIYMSVNAVNPSILFGGVWQQIKDVFLLAAGDTYANAGTGGEATHLLTAGESGQKGVTVSGGGHLHTGLRRSVFGSGSVSGFVSGAATQSDVSQTQLTIPVDSASGATGTHSHTISGASATSAHNNMPPYLTVNIWKRTG